VYICEKSKTLEESGKKSCGEEERGEGGGKSALQCKSLGHGCVWSVLLKRKRKRIGRVGLAMEAVAPRFVVFGSAVEVVIVVVVAVVPLKYSHSVDRQSPRGQKSWWGLE